MIGESRRCKRYLYALDVARTGCLVAFASDMDPVELMRLLEADQHASGVWVARFRVVVSVEVLRYGFEPPSADRLFDLLEPDALRRCGDIAEVSFYVRDKLDARSDP